MTPLPLIDVATPKAARTAEKIDTTTSPDAKTPDGERHFASLIAVDAKPEDAATFQTELEVEIPPGEVFVDETSLPDMAIIETAKAKSDVEVPVAALIEERENPRKTNDPVIEQKKILSAQPEIPRVAQIIDRAVPERRASLVQRMVEGKMPTAPKSAEPTPPAPASGEKDPSRSAVVSNTAAALVRSDGDAKPLPLIPALNTGPVLKDPAAKKVAEFSAFKNGLEMAPVDPKEPKAILRDPSTEVRPAQKSNPAGMPAALTHTPALLPVQSVDDVKKVIAGTGDVDVTQTLAVTERPQSTVAQQLTPASTAFGADTARHAAQQMAAHVTQHAGRLTEIALNPEELGRVRLAMTAVDAAITLSVLAERPETVDLLRRHIDVLAQEFRALGYDDISFSFGDERQTEDELSPEVEHFSGESSEEIDLTMQPAMRSVSGLDLRL